MKEFNVLDYITQSQIIAPRITIYGMPGIGKSTLASQFPDPLFFLTEQCNIPAVKIIGPPKNLDGALKVLESLVKLKEPPFKTLVIDSISKLDQLVVEYILSQELTKEGRIAALNSACGGYGAGFQAAQQLHRQIKALLDRFQSKNIVVVYIAHLATIKYKAPDLEDYDKYSIIMNHDKSREIYIDDVDCVVFCKLKSYLTSTKTANKKVSGRNMITSSDERIMLTGVSDVHVSKNRFNMPNELPMTFDSFAQYIPFYQPISSIKEEIAKAA